MLISVPAYLPYKTVSPFFTVTGSSFLPGPAAITVPRCGFSFAVSGIMIPPAVFSSAAAGFTITLSCRGITFTLLAILYVFLVLVKICQCYCPPSSQKLSGLQRAGCAKVGELYATTLENEKISVWETYAN